MEQHEEKPSDIAMRVARRTRFFMGYGIVADDK
jgi:hypothetical protein